MGNSAQKEKEEKTESKDDNNKKDQNNSEELPINKKEPTFYDKVTSYLPGHKEEEKLNENGLT